MGFGDNLPKSSLPRHAATVIDPIEKYGEADWLGEEASHDEAVAADEVLGDSTEPDLSNELPEELAETAEADTADEPPAEGSEGEESEESVAAEPLPHTPAPLTAPESPVETRLKALVAETPEVEAPVAPDDEKSSSPIVPEPGKPEESTASPAMTPEDEAAAKAKEEELQRHVANESKATLYFKQALFQTSKGNLENALERLDKAIALKTPGELNYQNWVKILTDLKNSRDLPETDLTNFFVNARHLAGKGKIKDALGCLERGVQEGHVTRERADLWKPYFTQLLTHSTSGGAKSLRRYICPHCKQPFAADYTQGFYPCDICSGEITDEPMRDRQTQPYVDPATKRVLHWESEHAPMCPACGKDISEHTCPSEEGVSVVDPPTPVTVTVVEPPPSPTPPEEPVGDDKDLPPVKGGGDSEAEPKKDYFWLFFMGCMLVSVLVSGLALVSR